MSITNFCHFPSLACHLSFCLGDFFSAGLHPTLIFFFQFLFSFGNRFLLCMYPRDLLGPANYGMCHHAGLDLFKPAKLNQGCLQEHVSGVIYWVKGSLSVAAHWRKCILFVMLDTSQLDWNLVWENKIFLKNVRLRMPSILQCASQWRTRPFSSSAEHFLHSLEVPLKFNKDLIFQFIFLNLKKLLRRHYKEPAVKSVLNDRK